jgi:hypothetical protein
LARGDIVYLPMTELGTSERYLDCAVKVFQPILSAESAILLGDSVVNTFQGKGSVGTSINLNPYVAAGSGRSGLCRRSSAWSVFDRENG